MSVRPSRAALVAGVLVFVCIAVLFCERTVPDRVVSLLGGPSGGVDRWGGLRVRYLPPTGSEAEIATYLEQTAHVQREGNTLVLEFPGVTPDTVDTLIDVLIAGGLAMKEALEDDWAVQIARSNELVLIDPGRESGELRPDPDDPRARLETDYWQPDDGNPHQTYYLEAGTREALEAAVARARTLGYELPPGREIAYETIEPEYEERRPRTRVRAYMLASEVLISGTMIDRATGSFEPNTGRPIVLLDFTREGGDAFCEITRRISGNKLATMLGGRIRSAPIINGPICGGRASITMGGADPDRQLRERDMLVEVLDHGALPTGGVVESKAWTPPPDLFFLEVFGRLLLGLLAGLAAALVTFVVVRFARPSVAPRSHGFTGAFPWRRLLVTAIAPAALIVGTRLTLPGIDEVELLHVTKGARMDESSVIALGLAPMLLAYALVELVALAIPPLRWRRHDPAGRIGLGRAVAVLAILLALAHGYFVARYFESISAFGIVSDEPGWRFRLILMISVTAGSLLLAIVAGLISEHGLGNGYGVLAATGIALDLIPDLDFVDPFTAQFALGLVMFAALVTAAMFVLRWRVAEGNQPALRVPTSGVSPLADSGAFISLVFTITGIAANATLFDLLIWSNVLTDWKVRIAIIAITIPVWAWIFARPSVIERVALQGGLERPTLAPWVRAMAVSALLLFGGALLTTSATLDGALGVFVNPISALLFAAVLLDVIADARARRAKLVPAGVIHQVQYLGAIEHALTDAAIPFHCHASHLRALLAFFAPWAPVHVLVSEEHAIEARLRIDNVLRASRGTVPEARAV